MRRRPLLTMKGAGRDGGAASHTPGAIMPSTIVYTVIQRQVRLYLREHDRQIPGNKGLTDTPTAAVVFALFTPVTLVHFAVDSTPSLQVHGVQDYHRIVCNAVGIDQAWYQGAATGQNSPPWITPP